MLLPVYLGQIVSPHSSQCNTLQHYRKEICFDKASKNDYILNLITLNALLHDPPLKRSICVVNED